MKNKQIYFYGVQGDLFKIIESLESIFEIKYAQAGLLNEKPSCILSLSNNSEVGNVKYGNWNFNPKFLILPKDKELKIRSVEQKKGGIKYAVDQMENDDSVVIYLGGTYQNTAIIASKIATLKDSKFAKDILIHVSNYMKNNFNNVKGFFVSSIAVDKSTEGYRLTTDVDSHVDYDLIW